MMDHRVPYATLLSMLLLELRAASCRDSIGALLKHLRVYSRIAPLTIDLHPNSLLLDHSSVSTSSGELDLLVTCMRLHQVSRIFIAEGASSRDVLQLAALLADVPGTRSTDLTVFEKARELSLWDIRLTPFPRKEGVVVPLPGVREFADVPGDVAEIRAEEVLRLLNHAIKHKNSIRAAILMRLLGDAERHSTTERRGVWTSAMERALTPDALKLVATELPSAIHDRCQLVEIFHRAGDAGANALIHRLTTADSLEERRTYFDAIVQLRAGVPLLQEMLRNPQWYHVRNAALLLGEMRAAQSDASLATLMSHTDERVRVAATTALSQLDTPAARVALQRGLHDRSAEVRRRSLRGFADDRGRATSAALLKALEGEPDPEVQVEILAAMGRLRSPDAIQKLVRLCSPLHTRAAAAEFRIAAAEALATARGTAALPVLREMLLDRDVQVAEGVRSLIATITTQAA